MGNTGSAIQQTFNDVDQAFSVVEKQIETGVGAVGQSVGDLFYPDNPDRRARVAQLQNDIQVYQTEFESLKKTIEEQLGGMQKKLDQLLKENKFNNVDEMDAFMQKTLNSDTLADWNEFKKMLNRDIAVENMVMTATGLLTIATGVVAYGLALCGAITFASAGTALEITGAIALVLGLAVAVLAIIDAHNEREELQKAIGKLVFGRVEAKQALEQLRIYTTFLSRFDSFLSSEILSPHPEMFNEFTAGTFVTSLEGITWPNIAAQLVQFDDIRPEHAWRNEDPDASHPENGKADRVEEVLNKARSNHSNVSKTISSMQMQNFSAASADGTKNGTSPDIDVAGAHAHQQPIVQFIHEKTSPNEDIKPQQFQLENYQSALDCNCRDVNTNDKWHIHANLDEKPSELVNLKNVTFTLTNLTKGNTFSNCRILLLWHA